ncbi:MAG: hypothetical protein ACTSR5_11405 [Promethearchaeota archaeon]
MGAANPVLLTGRKTNSTPENSRISMTFLDICAAKSKTILEISIFALYFLLLSGFSTSTEAPSISPNLSAFS